MGINVFVKKIICSVLESVGLVRMFSVPTPREPPAYVRMLLRSTILLSQLVSHSHHIPPSMMTLPISIASQATRKKTEAAQTLAPQEPPPIQKETAFVAEVSILKATSAKNQSNVHHDQLGVPPPFSALAMSAESI